MKDPQTTCHSCGSLLMLTPSGAVCSRDHRCGGLRLNVDRDAISKAWNFERDQKYVNSLPIAIQSGHDKDLEPIYKLGTYERVWRVMNVCEANSGLAKSYIPKLPRGSILGRLNIKDKCWVCVFTDGNDPDDDVSDEIRERVSRAYMESKFLNLEADLS